VDAGVARVSGAPPGVLAGFVMEPPVDRVLHSFPTRRSSDLGARNVSSTVPRCAGRSSRCAPRPASSGTTRCSTTRTTCRPRCVPCCRATAGARSRRPVRAPCASAANRWPRCCASPRTSPPRERAPRSPPPAPHTTSRPGQGVTFASLHSAKGLEWDAVFLVGVAEGMMPITYARTDEQIEEERRLLYVGVTRARERLHLSWALSRSPGGRPNRRPSRFLDGLRPGSGSGPGRAGAGGAGGVERGVPGAAAGAGPSGALPGRVRRQRSPARCRVCGRTLTDGGELKLLRCEECPSDMDEGLYERLREWRAEQARRSGQPAFCVFT